MARTAADERQSLVRRRFEDLLLIHDSREILGEASLALETEHLVQRSATRVRIHQNRAESGFGERQREIGRNERLAVSGGGARYGEGHARPGCTVQDMH